MIPKPFDACFYVSGAMAAIGYLTKLDFLIMIAAGILLWTLLFMVIHSFFLRRK